MWPHKSAFSLENPLNLIPKTARTSLQKNVATGNIERLLSVYPAIVFSLFLLIGLFDIPQILTVNQGIVWVYWGHLISHSSIIFFLTFATGLSTWYLKSGQKIDIRLLNWFMTIMAVLVLASASGVSFFEYQITGQINGFIIGTLLTSFILHLPPVQNAFLYTFNLLFLLTGLGFYQLELQPLASILANTGFFTLAIIIIARFSYFNQISHEIKNQKMLETNQRLHYLATHDEVTRLYNRRSFEAYFEEFLDDLNTTTPSSCLVLLDLDHFKFINDTYGHNAGDTVLEAISLLIVQTIPPEAIAARWGGEEFIILFPNTTKQRAFKNAEELRRKISEIIITIDNQEIGVTASFGLTLVLKNPSTTQRSLFSQADQALYTAKESGRNKIIWFDSN